MSMRYDEITSEETKTMKDISDVNLGDFIGNLDQSTTSNTTSTKNKTTFLEVLTFINTLIILIMMITITVVVFKYRKLLMTISSKILDSTLAAPVAASNTVAATTETTK